MSRQIFVNLPVADVAASRAFFTALGFTFNDAFSDENAANMIIGDAAFAMLLNHQRYSDFTDKAIADARTTSEAIFAVSAESREAVDAMVNTALENGGTKAKDPQDHGFMYGWSFQDLDGHHWEVMWMQG